MLPPRASRPALDQGDGVPAIGVPVVWNGAPLNAGGSAKSLGLVRVDSESTATVTRQHDGKSKADWTDGSDTLDRQSKPAPSPDGDDDHEDDDDGDGPATVLKGQKKIVLPEPEAHASSDDDDLNETARADEDSAETPVGLKKLASTPPATAPATAPASAAEPPESGRTRVAPITVPPAATAKATPVMGPNTPPHAWTPSTIPPPPPQGLAALGPAIAAKALTLPPHKLALIVSMTLMVAALTFVFVRSRQPAVAAAPPVPAMTEQGQFPPPVEVATFASPPPPTVVLPPPAPTWTSQPQAQPHPTVAAKPPPAVHRAPTRATSRTSIPVHREQ